MCSSDRLFHSFWHWFGLRHFPLGSNHGIASAWQSPQQAIQDGLVSTGGIITAAGMVMACAFGGMLFSSMFQEAMFGFMICSAVLYDTFIARSLVTPAGMSLLGYCNWWPSPLSWPDDWEDVEAESVDGE